MKHVSRLAIVVGILSLAHAATAASSTPVLTKDLPNVPGYRLTSVRLYYAPGASAPHRHLSGYIMAYVMSGAVESQVEGQILRTYHAGETWTEGPGAHHIVSRNASATEPAEVLVVFIARSDAILTEFDR